MELNYSAGLPSALRDRPARAGFLQDLVERVAPCPWGAHIGLRARKPVALARRAPLYSPEERRRRDTSPWTRVQAVLAPLQFVAFAVSLALIGRYFLTGAGFEAATVSVLVKTFLLYAIMVTGSIWEKQVFGRWLFARAFFWEDVVSMLVLALQTAYVAALLGGWGSPRDQLMIAVAAYAAYAVNASQFLFKLRAARLGSGAEPSLRGAAALGAAAT